MAELRCEVVPAAGGHRYRIFDQSKLLLESGTFKLSEDAKRCGQHIAGDPLAVFDFLKRI